MNDTLKQTTVAPEQFVTQRRIGSTLYRVRARFNEHSRETLDDKIIRLLKNDLNAGAKHDRVETLQTGWLPEGSSQ